MFENVIISKYNKIIYLLCLDDDIKKYKKNILNEKYNLYKIIFCLTMIIIKYIIMNTLKN